MSDTAPMSTTPDGDDLLAGSDGGFVLLPPETNEPRRWHPILAQRMRYCLDCGNRLPPPGEVACCDRCQLAFDPEDPSSFSPVPPPVEPAWWERPAWRIALAAVVFLAGLVLYGSGLLQLLLGVSPLPTYLRVDSLAWLMVVLVGVAGLLPWLVLSPYLILVALEPWLRDSLPSYYTAGGVAGMLCLASVHPIFIPLGVCLGVLAALLRQRQMN